MQCDESLAGKYARCPGCNTRFVLPGLPQDADDFQETIQSGGSQKSSRVKTTSGRTPGKKGIGSDVDGTNVNSIVTGLVGLGFTIVFYLFVLMIKNTYFAALFLQRGWVPFAEVFLMWWSVAILIFKSRKLARQKQCMLFDILPEEISPDITQETIDQFIDNARKLKAKASESFLTIRVLRALEHFRVRNSNPEVATVLSSQSDVDANAVQSSYTLLKIFIWAIPILGFIGTVQGLGSAVGGFASGLEGAADISVLKGSLGKITVGLAVAFDTTLIALIMAVPLMFFTSSMQKAEEDLLNTIDEFCNENLLKRLNEMKSDVDKNDPLSGLTENMRTVMEQTFALHQTEIEAWKSKFEEMGVGLSNQVVESWEQVHARLQEKYEQQLETIQLTIAGITTKNSINLKAINSMQEKMVVLQKNEMDQLKLLTEATSQNLKLIFEQLNKGLERLGEETVEIPGGQPSFWKRIFGKNDHGRK